MFSDSSESPFPLPLSHEAVHDQLHMPIYEFGDIPLSNGDHLFLGSNHQIGRTPFQLLCILEAVCVRLLPFIHPNFACLV